VGGWVYRSGMKQMLLSRPASSKWLPFWASVLFSTQVDAHAIVDAHCPTTLLYDSESIATSLKKQPLDLNLNRVSASVVKTIDGSTDVYNLELNLGDDQSSSVLISFLGPYFEIRSVRLSSDTELPQLFVIDKPAARGYRYTVVPLDLKFLGIKVRAKDYAPPFLSAMTLPIHNEYGMPDSIYPLLTKIGVSSSCDLVLFEERFDEYFRDPEFWVSPTVFLFNSGSGVIEENQTKTENYRLAEWNDIQYQIQRLINELSDATHVENTLPESYLSVPKYLWLAKTFDRFEEAIERVNQLIKIYAGLEGLAEYDRAPLMFAPTGVNELKMFKKVNNDLGLFDGSEFELIEQTYRNFNYSEGSTGG